MICQPGVLCSILVNKMLLSCLPTYVGAALLLDYVAIFVYGSIEGQGDYCTSNQLLGPTGRTMMVINLVGTAAFGTSFLDCRQ